MTARKIRALCKTLGISTTNYVDLFHGFYDEVEADTHDDLEPRVMQRILDMQLSWYETELAKLAKTKAMHLCPDLFKRSGILICDGGTKSNPWEGVTRYARVDPVEGLWRIYQTDVNKGASMPDFKVLERHCRQLARAHWVTFDNLQWEQVV